MNPSLASAARAYARGLRVIYGLDGHSVEEAARLAWRPGGLPIPELERRIRERREVLDITAA